MPEPSHRRPCDDALPELLDGKAFEVPQPLAGREWTDDTGVTWRRRGQGLLTQGQARRLMSRSEVHVAHVFLGAVHEHQGADRDGLIAEVEAFWAGYAASMATFDMGEFRDDSHRVMVIIVEGC